MKHRGRVRAAACLMCAASAAAQIYAPPKGQTYSTSPILRKVGIDQKLGAPVPLDLPFDDESGQPVVLRRYFGKPVVLALVYYQCPSLCNLVLSGVLRSVKNLAMTAGDEYEIVAVSFDPRETPEMAAAKKQTYMKAYNRPNADRGWHFLTGPETSSKALADAVGFQYAYDPLTNQYAHASGIVILTPQGQVTRYFFGIEYPERDLRLSLVEASRGRIGSVVDQVLLYCFHYNPSNGKYGVAIVNVLRLGGLITLAALVGFMIVMFRRDYRAAAHRGAT
jgi:protein SCO1/2